MVIQKMNQSKIVQLDFFKSSEQSEIDSIRERVEAIGISSSKVRKSLYARNGELNKKMLDLETRMEIIEKNICKGNKNG